MAKRTYNKSSREGGRFIALPTVVLESEAYKSLSYTAKALLLEFALQNFEDNNGRLLCSMRYLKTRGWKSADVVTRAKRELLNAEFIFETVKGCRPNKASWYAVTWYRLADLKGYDLGVKAAFQLGAYRKNQHLIPANGTKPQAITPDHGIGVDSLVPCNGTITGDIPTLSIPATGNHLDKPSIQVNCEG